MWTAMVVGLVTDLTRQTIYNWITFPAAALGLALGAIDGGWAGLGIHFLGLLVGLAILFVPFAFGGVGGGDVKLLAAAGALAGPLFILKTGLYAVLLGGVGAVVVLALSGRIIDGFKAVFGFIRDLLPWRETTPLPSLDLPPIPYAVYLIGGAVWTRYLEGWLKLWPW